MKKVVTLLFALFVLVMPACAEEAQPFAFDGAEVLTEEAPSQARQMIDDELTDVSPSDMQDFSFSQLWKVVVEQLKQQFWQPVKLFFVIVGIILLCVLIDGMKASFAKGTLESVFSTVGVLCIAATIVAPILECVRNVAQVIHDLSIFMLSFIPVYTGVMMAGGQPVTGAAYNTFLFGACEVISQIAAGTLVPLLGIYFAFCLVGSVNPALDLGGAANLIKNVTVWTLGFLMTVFVGLLSVQGLVSASADTVAVRATKFAIGSLVPVVGSALSEAFNSLQGCVNLLKSSIGAFSVLVTVITVLPSLIQCLFWKLVLAVSQVVADLFGLAGISKLLKAASTVLTILVSILLLFAMLIIVSSTVMMLIARG